VFVNCALKSFFDAHGVFMKTYNQSRFADPGIFVRALHPFPFKLHHLLAQLCTGVLHGETSIFSKPADSSVQLLLWYAAS
jgi:hypothetical protein